MAYGTSGGNKTTTYFKIKGLKKSDKDLYFEGHRSNGKGYEVIPERPTYLEGAIKEIKTDSYEFEGEKKYTVKIVLEDEDQRDILEMNLGTIISTSVINTLAGSDIGLIKISLYTSKTGYPSIFIEADKGLSEVKWAWDYKKIIAPKIKSVKFAGKTLQDKTELVEFLVKEINSEGFQKKYSGVFTPSSNVEQQTTATTAAEDIKVKDAESVSQVDDDEDGLPF